MNSFSTYLLFSTVVFVMFFLLTQSIDFDFNSATMKNSSVRTKEQKTESKSTLDSTDQCKV